MLAASASGQIKPLAQVCNRRSEPGATEREARRYMRQLLL